MSRIGSKPIDLTDGVEVIVSSGTVTVKGSKGELSFKPSKGLSIDIKDNVLFVTPRDEEKKTREVHGLTRTLISNMIEGVKNGFVKNLEFTGVGYRAQVEGRDLVLNLGYSHPIRYTPKDGIEIKVEKNVISVSGIDKQAVGQVAAEIRSFRKPEPYKGKGIKYEGEHIRRKAGKSAAKGAA
ncbi:MAG: 50S ribosomal protein L6 [Patescibacteria group bacterium]|nr:50S ribosomal protein L6 [Patescibacteria group bacterium]